MTDADLESVWAQKRISRFVSAQKTFVKSSIALLELNQVVHEELMELANFCSGHEEEKGSKSDKGDKELRQNLLPLFQSLLVATTLDYQADDDQTPCFKGTIMVGQQQQPIFYKEYDTPVTEIEWKQYHAQLQAGYFYWYETAPPDGADDEGNDDEEHGKWFAQLRGSKKKNTPPDYRIRLDGLETEAVDSPGGECIISLYHPQKDKRILLCCDTEEERLLWIQRIKSAALPHLHGLQRTITKATNLHQYFEQLQQFPKDTVEVSTEWLYRNVNQRGTMSLKQLLKDVTRDQISVHSTVYSGEDVLSNVLTDLTAKLYALYDGDVHAQRAEQEMHVSMGDTSAADGADGSRLRSGSESAISAMASMSEVEVLRFVLVSIAGSTRTAAGGDILDAVYFFLQNPLVHILPESKKSYPVKLECVMEGGDQEGTAARELCIMAKVVMEFQIVSSIPSASDKTKEYFATGTFTRKFVLGSTKQPGRIRVEVSSRQRRPTRVNRSSSLL
jgi:hypothetical protein